jgi:hypothetical protein
MEKVLAAVGVFPSTARKAAAAALYEEGCFEDSHNVLTLVCIGRSPSSEVKDKISFRVSLRSRLRILCASFTVASSNTRERRLNTRNGIGTAKPFGVRPWTIAMSTLSCRAYLWSQIVGPSGVGACMAAFGLVTLGVADERCIA